MTNDRECTSVVRDGLVYTRLCSSKESLWPVRVSDECVPLLSSRDFRSLFEGRRTVSGIRFYLCLTKVFVSITRFHLRGSERGNFFLGNYLTSTDPSLPLKWEPSYPNPSYTGTRVFILYYCTRSPKFFRSEKGLWNKNRIEHDHVMYHITFTGCWRQPTLTVK